MKRHVIVRDCADYRPYVYSIFQQKRLGFREIIRSRRMNLFGNEVNVPVVVAHSFMLTKGHYMLVEAPNVYEMFVDEEGQFQLYAPDFIPEWLSSDESLGIAQDPCVAEATS